MERVKNESMQAVKTYKVIKEAIWACSVRYDKHGELIDKAQRRLDVKLLMSLLEEINTLLLLHE